MVLNKKPTKYCRIFNWIKNNDADFAEIMSELCLERIADVNKFMPSVTFLYPSSELRDKITSAYYNNPDDAIDMITSLVIPYGFSTLNEFSKNPEYVGNKLGFKFPAGEFKNKQVTFQEGNKTLVIKDAEKKLEPLQIHDKYTNPDTKGKSKKDNNEIKYHKIYIYDIVSGEPPNNKNKFVSTKGYTTPKENDVGQILKSKLKPKPKPKNSGIKSGSNEDYIIDESSYLAGTLNNLTTSNSRTQFCKLVELFAYENISTINTYDPYLLFTILLLEEIKKADPDLFSHINSLFDMCPMITFYIILEPYKSKGDLIISSSIFTTEVLTKIYTDVTKTMKVNITDTSYGNYMNRYSTIISDNIKCNTSMIFNDTTKLVDKINDIKNNLLKDIDQVDLPIKIKEVYKLIDKDNKLKAEDPSNLFPDILMNHYRTYENKKLWQDEYRFLLRKNIDNIKSELNIDIRKLAYDSLCVVLFYNLRGDSYGEELCIMNYPHEKVISACLKEQIKIMQVFVNSSDFLYIGCQYKLKSSDNKQTHCVDDNAIPYISSS